MTLRQKVYKYKKKIYKRIQENLKTRFLHKIPPYRNFASFKILAYHGIGNQLFQYAAVRTYCLRYNLPFLLPEPTLHHLDNFKVNCIYVPQEDIRLVNKNVFKEQEFSYNDNFFKYETRKYFVGYFQTEKYFKDYKNTIKQELSIKDRRIKDYCRYYINRLRSQYPDKQIIAIHNRRGDYVPSDRNYNDRMNGIFRTNMNDYHPVISLDYIMKAQSFFSDAIFLVFSNNKKDISWCKKYIKGEKVFYSENHSDITDFYLMSICDHNIISNSSFSWWAAWLNRKPSKVVIAPKKWLGEAYNDWDICDLLPKTWLVI